MGLGAQFLYAYAFLTGPAVWTSSDENTVGSKDSKSWSSLACRGKTSSLETNVCSLTLLKFTQRCLEEKCLGMAVCLTGIQHLDAVLKAFILRMRTIVSVSC